MQAAATAALEDSSHPTGCSQGEMPPVPAYGDASHVKLTEGTDSTRSFSNKVSTPLRLE